MAWPAWLAPMALEKQAYYNTIMSSPVKICSWLMQILRNGP